VPCTGPDLFVSLTSRGELVRNPTARLLHAGIAPAEGHFVRPDLPVTGMAARGKPETAIETGSGATVAYQPAVAIGGEKHESYFVHPPWRGEGKGYTFWQRTVRVPKDATLDFYTAMSERAPGRSDGIVFIVQMAEEGGQFEEIYRTTQIAHEWKHHTVSLARWTGKAARLKFIADCGPKDDTTTDQGYWGDVRVLGPGQDEKAATKPVRFMTWVNDKDFTSGFYFSDIRSSQVDLEFIMESAEPVWLKELAAYAHPDAMYREFERGLVVANPSPRPYTFDLERLFPGKRFRRLKGTANQDTQTNDGSAVGSRLTLEPKDALFLVREQSPL
jgi:hypothetical protein